MLPLAPKLRDQLPEAGTGDGSRVQRCGLERAGAWPFHGHCSLIASRVFPTHTPAQARTQPHS